MWKALRISLLSTLLLAVAFTAWVERARSVSWTQPLWVGVFPLAADDSPATARYLEDLRPADFTGIADFMRREARRYGREGEPVRLQLYPRVTVPLPTRDNAGGGLANVWWSLRLRWYAWRRTSELTTAPPHVRLFVVYHDPARAVKVPHSVGLEKGLVGVVHAFAGRELQGANQIVIAHELLHTLGASDKYDAADLPRFPEGYADPRQEPLLPQRRAEVMAGRRLVAAGRAEMPDTLRDVVVGSETAREIRWVP
jgi:hypothetical protein